ncbi:hypothetical protein HMPREF1487_09046 [Pseudomonas sp. HPB0071]|uniref:hypothetical protein n=1 Tax=unclassified Pseudomonas TaxID=196821 RepID=UPI0002C8FD34|nr:MULTISPECIES: hypothetical protein [unclassified Pseudomonas]ENA27863.1 hypothetical protein HMPREF1487_09046 [Pseudomonas sp. HPB0071]
MSIKDTIAKMDEKLVAELMEAAQLALNDDETCKRVAEDMQVPFWRIQALAYVAIEVSGSTGNDLEIMTQRQLQRFTSAIEP